ncbi:hypothetical protein IX317_001140 [Fusobacterium sp. DD29]|uniref:GNAT family N-acetyltransferase n=1 Tax=unclassified Fusobacterium TaxID=2648384 RepID=UPI001B8D4BBB|nr:MULTISPECIES: GNAT family protein [unclassified Fusobacterium]MBR8701942.1 hypothetical protein [Fusobacterium sp. DD45]MBR8711743.1 hypothetical protein [Fusobacterium sp. DD28]MBR8749466.1 hypothetical protein [Fusobacterium sp. DD29]MBR8752305.1 hypothetical protein [Fusobacterium sp. DD26]MBR8761705.1 hypothetical protein [Fusobacterium sp. DD25]
MILLRETVEDDIPEIYRYIHLNYVKKYCDNPEKQWETHKKWYQFLIHSDAYLLYTVSNLETGEFYGCVKFEIDGECATINVYLVEGIRHKGYSEKIIDLSIDELRMRHPEISIVLAYILEENTPSLSAFKHLGFQFDGVEEYKGLEHMLFIKTLD